MFPILAIAAALGLVFAMNRPTRTISVSPGDLYRLRVAVPATDKSQIEAMYRLAMAQVGQLGSLTWDGNIMTVQVQYLRPSTITLGEMRAGTGTINMLSADLLARTPPPVALPSQLSPDAAAAVAGVVKRAVRSGDPTEIIGAAALAEKVGAPRLAKKLVKAASVGYRVRA